MNVVTAPEKFNTIQPHIFLAGGITNCEDWQSKVIDYLDEWFKNASNIFVYNPRRENFPIDDLNAVAEQIVWEYQYLKTASIFTMYFCNSESDQPICMYELGRYVEHMKHRFNDYKARIVISVENGYKRAKDVEIQMGLLGIPVFLNATPQTHAELIKRAYMNLY